MGLLARTRRLDEGPDLVGFACAEMPAAAPLLFLRGQAGLAGRGEACRIPWPEGDPHTAGRQAAEMLAAIPTDDEVGVPGTGAVAFGALPFVPGTASELVVPREVVGVSEDGTRWFTTIGDDTASAASAVPAAQAQAVAASSAAAPMSSTGGEPTAENGSVAPDASPEPRTYTVRSSLPPEAWRDLVRQATGELASDSDLRKVVLAREVTVTADRPFSLPDVLGRLRSSYPGCHIVCVDGLVAASPELLVSRRGDVVRSHPMAGTAPRGGDPTADQALAASLLASAKDRAEHQVTIDMVQDTLLNWCSYVDYEAEPSVVAVANVQHLASLVEGRLFRPAPSVLELAAALHPTPAVAGWPRELAVDWIGRHEGMDRRRYAGTAGWVDGAGNGSWSVTVRSAELAGTEATVFAGCGIVADSDPDRELAETRAKFQSLLSALVRP